MELKKTRFCVKYTLIFGIASFLFAILIFFLTQSGVIHKQPVENPDLSQGLSYAISLILFVIYLVGQMIMSFCTAMFGAISASALNKGKNIRAFLIVVSIIESAFAAVNAIGVFVIFGFKFVVGGVFSLICALGFVMCVAMCVVSAREIKSSFVNGIVNIEQNIEE